MDKCAAYAKRMASGEINGADLAVLVTDGTLNKAQRRSIQKQATKLSSGKVTSVAPVSVAPAIKAIASSSVEKKRKVETEKVSEKVQPAKVKKTSSTTSTTTSSSSSSSSSSNKEEPEAHEDSPDENEESADDNNDDDNTTGVGLTPKQLKMKVKLLNKELAAFAMKKQLTEAKRRLAYGLRKGLKPDVHTWTNMINCHVRCGDVAGAELVLLHDMPAAGVIPNVVTLTTMLKGYGEAGNIRAARRILFEELPRMSAVASNKEGDAESSSASHTRAVFTYLRGCARTGAVGSAEEALTLLSSDAAGISASAKAHVTSLYCQALRTADANRVVTTLPPQTAAGGGLALDAVAAFLAMGQMHALLGRLTEAFQWGRKARSTLAAGKSQNLLMAMKRHSGSALGSISAATNTGTEGSAELFATHQRGELEADINALDSFINSLNGDKQANQYNSTLQRAKGDFKLAARLLRQLGQTLIFGYDGKGDLEAGISVSSSSSTDASAPVSTTDMSQALLQALREKLGLDNSIFTSPQLESLHSAVESKVSKLLHAHSGHVDLKALFTPLPRMEDASSSRSKRATKDLPVKLEICSGAGDWVARQAHADQGKANWLALELRCDRSCAALRKHLLFSHDQHAASSDSNLAILSGDASQVIHSRISSDSISAIFVNHPEPPERSMMVDRRERVSHSAGGGGVSKVQGAHLLTQGFLRDLCRVLLIARKAIVIPISAEEKEKEDREQTGRKRKQELRDSASGGTAAGCLTIVTDSLPYAKILAESLASMQPVDNGGEDDARYVFQSVPLGEGGDGSDDEAVATRKLEHRVTLSAHDMSTSDTRLGRSEISNVVNVWRGDIVTAGVRDVISASSYFDRMWSAGNKNRRWFIHVKKVKI